MEWFTSLLHNTYFIWCAMAILLFAITQILKLPIKHFTNKIQNKKIRTIVNTTILLIPFALGILFEFLYSTLYLEQAFNALNGLGYGMAATSLYGIIERFFKVKVEDPYKNSDGESVKNFISSLVEDGKIDENDADTIRDFISNMMKKEPDSEEEIDEETAENEENQQVAAAIQEFLNKVKNNNGKEN